MELPENFGETETTYELKQVVNDFRVLMKDISVNMSYSEKKLTK